MDEFYAVVIQPTNPDDPTDKKFKAEVRTNDDNSTFYGDSLEELFDQLTGK